MAYYQSLATYEHPARKILMEKKSTISMIAYFNLKWNEITKLRTLHEKKSNGVKWHDLIG